MTQGFDARLIRGAEVWHAQTLHNGIKVVFDRKGKVTDVQDSKDGILFFVRWEDEDPLECDYGPYKGASISFYPPGEET